MLRAAVHCALTRRHQPHKLRVCVCALSGKIAQPPSTSLSGFTIGGQPVHGATTTSSRFVRGSGAFKFAGPESMLDGLSCARCADLLMQQCAKGSRATRVHELQWGPYLTKVCKATESCSTQRPFVSEEHPRLQHGTCQKATQDFGKTSLPTPTRLAAFMYGFRLEILCFQLLTFNLARLRDVHSHR